MQVSVDKRDTAKLGEQLTAVTDLGVAINSKVTKDLALVGQVNLIPQEYFDPQFPTKIKGNQRFWFLVRAFGSLL